MKNKFCFKMIARKYLNGRGMGAVIVGIASLCIANLSSALGLGEITLKSTLDQPLDAEIQLLEVRDLTASEILIGLASEEVFDRQGVERNFFLTGIRYQVVMSGPGSPYVRLYTDRPVREPFLNFILEAQWPSGKLLREYTVLLDLPIFSDEAAAPISPVQTETVSQQQVIRRQATVNTQNNDSTQLNPRSSFDEGRQVNRPAPIQSQAPASVSSGPSASYQPSFSGDEVSVQRNDTLWEIALSVRPDSSVSVHQTMMALHRANPDAFINGNINLLKAGRVLRVPGADEIRSLNRQQAVQQVAQHNAEWTSGDAVPLEASTVNFDTNAEQASREGRLSLDSPDESFNASEGRVSGGADVASADIEALSQELNATQETLDKTQGENTELRSKIGSLEDQIQTLESMLEVSNESLRAMELAAAKEDDLPEPGDDLIQAAEEGVDATADELASVVDELESAVSDVEPSESDVSEVLDENIPDLYSDEFESSLEDQSETNQESDLAEELDQTEELEKVAAKVEEVVEEAEKPEPKVKPIPLPKPSKPSLVDTIMEYLPFIGLGFIALLAGIWFAIKRRSSSDDDGDFDAFFGSDFDSTPEDEDEDQVELEPVEELEEDLESVVEESFELEDISAEDPVEEESPEPETEDVVAESDIYIAYGKYDQAEEMLLKALNADSSHHEARLKLLEVYAAQGNLESFDPNYATLRTNGASDDLVARAASLRGTIAGAGDFDASDDELNTVSESKDEGSLDLDLNLGGEDLSSPAAEDELVLDLGLDDSDSKSDDLDFDLDGLDFGDDVAGEDDSAKASEAPGLDLDESSTGDIDFDLEGLDDLELGDVDDIDLELDLGSDDAEEPKADATPLDLDDVIELQEEGDLDLDLDELALDSDSTSDNLDEVLDLGIEDVDLNLSDVAELPETTDDTDEMELSNQDELEPVPTQFDMAALDEELDALTSGLDEDLDVSKTLELEVDGASEDLTEASASVERSLEDELEADLADLPELSIDDEAQAELDATLAKGEDILAELDIDSSLEDLDSEVPKLEEPELSFDELDDLTADLSEESSETTDALSGQETSEVQDASLDFELPEIDPDATDDGDLDFLTDSDETATKLDLASAYIDMGDMSGAKEIIDEILKEGNADQQAAAKELLDKIGS